jgi:sugar phosphate permease
VAASAKRKAYINIVLPLFLASVIAYLDRVNIGYAALTMNKDLGLTAQMFGMGAGIFFTGYILFEIPGALVAERYSPKLWLARIMLTWGAVSALMAFMTATWHFYVLRFLLGAAEASLYPVIYASCVPRWFSPADRARAIALLLTSLQISGIIGAPLAGWLLGVPLFGLKGWQALFLIEAIPALVFAFIIVSWMADRPADAAWLTDDERKFLTDRYEAEIKAKAAVKQYTILEAFREPEVIKLCIAYFLWITGFWGFNYWMPQVLKSLSGWSNLEIGWLTVVPMTVSLGAMLFIGAIGMGVGVFMTQPWIAFFFVVLAAVGTYAPFGVWWSYPTTFLSGTAAAGAIGLINSFGNLGGFVGPYITGYIKEATGSFTGAWVYLACSLTLAGLLVLRFKKNPPAQ